MENLIQGWGLLWLIPIIIIHEAGHAWYDHKVTGKWSKIGFLNGGLGAVLDQSKHTLKTAQFTLIAGIIAGFLPTLAIIRFFLNADGLNAIASHMIYFFLCSSDFTMIFLLINAKNSYKLSWDTPLRDVPCERCKHLSQEDIEKQKKEEKKEGK